MAHKIFNGSVNDAKSLVEMIEFFVTAKDDEKKFRVMINGGIATRENLIFLRQHGFAIW